MAVFLRVFLAAALGLAAGCDRSAPGDSASQQPRFEPERFFAGHVRSWGVIENRSGDPTARFTADIQGWHDGPVLVIEQRFAFDDGRKQERVWRLRRIDDHRYEAWANDVVGTAIGEAHGNAFRLEYTLAIDPGNALKNVHMKQWMYAVGDGSAMMNRVTVTKWGVTIAEVTESFLRDQPPPLASE